MLKLAYRQKGFTLIEGLFAILIFSFGILALVAFQARSIKEVGDAKYRIDASMLANQVVGQIWSGDRTITTLEADYKTPDYGGGETIVDGGPKYQLWANEVADTLPQADMNRPSIVFNADNSITITVKWLNPGEPTGAPVHQYQTIVQII